MFWSVSTQGFFVFFHSRLILTHSRVSFSNRSPFTKELLKTEERADKNTTYLLFEKEHTHRERFVVLLKADKKAFYYKGTTLLMSCVLFNFVSFVQFPPKGRQSILKILRSSSSGLKQRLWRTNVLLLLPTKADYYRERNCREVVLILYTLFFVLFCAFCCRSLRFLQQVDTFYS